MSTNGHQVFLTLKFRFMLYLLMLNFGKFFSLFIIINFMLIKKECTAINIIYVRHIFNVFYEN